MPLFNDRRNSSPATDISMPNYTTNQRAVMNYTTPKGAFPGADMYGATYKPSTTGGSRYAQDMASINKMSDKGAKADQARWANRGAAASTQANINKPIPSAFGG